MLQIREVADPIFDFFYDADLSRKSHDPTYDGATEERTHCVSMIKRLMEEKEALRGMALSLLLEVGALQECEIDEGGYYDGDGDLEAAYRLGNSKITQGEIELPLNTTRRAFTDIIKSVYDDNCGDACSWCENRASKD